MNDEELKLKYKNLFYNVNSINNRLNNVLSKVNDLNTYLKENAVIDEQIIEKENYNKAKNELNSVTNEINYSVIPSLRNKAFR